MKVKLFAALVLTLVLALGTAAVVSAVSGAAFTTFNPWVDGFFKEVCKNSIINCNIYGQKPDVWLNGGPSANGLAPAGDYFFAVLVPGGQPNPNDGGPKNLSDDYDLYTNRTFTITDGEVVAYTGTHDMDSGDFINANRKYCNSPRGCSPDGSPPLIRLYPFADTWNPGGVYILAICSLADGYPVEPRDCKYDAFKVKEGPLTASLYLSGMKFEDMMADGKADWVDYVYQDPGLTGWSITIVGTGFLGEAINETITTDATGFWSFQKDYSVSKGTTFVAANLTVCEIVTPGWTQSFPVGCYPLTIQPAAFAEVNHLDFGNWYPGDKSGVKFEDLDADGSAREVGEPLLEGWTMFVDYDGDGALDADEPSDATDAWGAYTITGIKPGTWTVREVLKDGWTCSFPSPCSYTELFKSRTHKYGNDFGNWYPGTKSGHKFYDNNANGVKDAEDPYLPGWPVELYKDGVLMASTLTDATGFYAFIVPPGSYVVKEVCPVEGNWHQSAPAPIDVCGSGTHPFSVVSRQVHANNDFGNYRLGFADFGTKGYWHNQNGLGELVADPDFGALLADINALDPYNSPTGYFDNGEELFDGLDEWGNFVPPAIDSKDFGPLLNEISQFLVDPNANGDPREQLAQQLLAFTFNVNYRLGNFDTAFRFGGVWYTGQGLINAAVNAWSFEAAAEQTAIKDILDALNNSDAIPFIIFYP